MNFGADHEGRSLAYDRGATTDFRLQTPAKQRHLPENATVGLIALNSDPLPYGSRAAWLFGTDQSSQAVAGHQTNYSLVAIMAALYFRT
jgi:hypothetical protein